MNITLYITKWWNVPEVKSAKPKSHLIIIGELTLSSVIYTVKNKHHLTLKTKGGVMHFQSELIECMQDSSEFLMRLSIERLKASLHRWSSIPLSILIVRKT